jgi:uncharacterized protein YjeT (DUF2065 family)
MKLCLVFIVASLFLGITPGAWQGSELGSRKARFVPLVVAGQPVKFTNFVVYKFVRD